MMLWQPRPNSHGARILEHLMDHPEGVSDADLQRALGGGVSHPTINITCRNLQNRGLLVRRQVGSTIKNFLSQGGAASAVAVHLSAFPRAGRRAGPGSRTMTGQRGVPMGEGQGERQRGAVLERRLSPCGVPDWR